MFCDPQLIKEPVSAFQSMTLELLVCELRAGPIFRIHHYPMLMTYDIVNIASQCRRGSQISKKFLAKIEEVVLIIFGDDRFWVFEAL